MTPQNPTRIDVLFQDVRAMELRNWFTSIAIDERDISYLQGFQSQPTEMLEPGLKAYALVGAGWNGYIVAGIMSVHEDEGEAYDESALMAGSLKRK